METKYSKDGIDVNEYYDNSKTNNILTIKSPYDILDDSFCRQVYKFNDNYLSDSEKSFIKSNETPQFTPTLIMISWATLSSLTT